MFLYCKYFHLNLRGIDYTITIKMRTMTDSSTILIVVKRETSALFQVCHATNTYNALSALARSNWLYSNIHVYIKTLMGIYITLAFN